MRMAKGKQFIYVEADTSDYPVFSEAFLYSVVFDGTALTKGDARFIEGVGLEYSRIIELLGEDAVRELLSLKMPCQVTFTVRWPNEQIESKQD